MSAQDPTVFANDALARLQDKKDILPWSRRLDMAATLGRHLGAFALNDDMLALVFLLADDPKPEVRKEIADGLVHLPEEPFTKLAAKLTGDHNSFVKKAAERSIARRRRSAREQERTRRKLGSVDKSMASFQEVYGPAAMKQARRIADEQYSALVRQTHHNIPNILSPIKTSITTLLKQFEKGQPDVRFCTNSLHEMARRLEYLERFLNDMKEYAKARTGSERRRELLTRIVSEAQGMAVAAVRAAGTPVDTVAVDVDVPEMLTISVARHQVVMALVHVIRNSYEAFETDADRQKDCRIRIAARAVDAGAVEVTIEDNGPGVHPEDLEMLRELAPIDKSRKPRGTGFGLATAASYVEAQGGVLCIDSVQGEGFAVTMTLPIECEDEEI